MDDGAILLDTGLGEAAQRGGAIGKAVIADDESLAGGEDAFGGYVVVGVEVGEEQAVAVGNGDEGIAGEDGVEDTAVWLGCGCDNRGRCVGWCGCISRGWCVRRGGCLCRRQGGGGRGRCR